MRQGKPLKARAEKVMKVTEVLSSAFLTSGKLLLRTLPVIILGVILGEFLTSLKLVEKLSFLAKPITNFSHLRHECGITFITAFASPTAANSMLARYYDRGLIKKKELFLASMLNSFPAIVMHWKYMLPVLLPLLGRVGLLYFSLLVLVGLVQTGLLMIVSRLILKGGSEQEIAIALENDVSRPSLKEALKLSLKSSRNTIKKIVKVIIPSQIVTCILIELGVFEKIASSLSGITSYFPIPPEGLGIVAAQLGHSNAAYAVASGLLSSGEISEKGVVLSLLAGDVLSAIVVMFRYLMPYYVGIFGLRTGLELMCISVTIRNGIVVVFILVLALFW